MDIVPTPIDGVLLIRPKVWRDARGFFVETWQLERYREAGVALPFVQDNYSSSAYGILRGLHFQRSHPQGKLVHVSAGAVFDVAVDIRPGSPTFGKWYGTVLSEENQHQLWVPPGLAHGYCVISEHAGFQYKCTEIYHPDDEGGLRWNDPDIGIAWPVKEPFLSAKDADAPFFREYFPDGKTPATA
jgi:dTDP-4-dehydrorhamnose 3,5-epimerase